MNERCSARRLSTALVAAALAIPAACRQSTPGPCVIDPLGCGPPDVLTLDPSCELVGALQVTLGDGNIATFMPLTPELEPELQYGSQGGQHYQLGVRIDNPAPSAPGLEIHFIVRGAIECPLEAGRCAEWSTLAERRAVVTDEALLQTTSEGAVVTAGYVVVLEESPYWWAGEVDTRVQVVAEVRDRCDRRGTAIFDFIAPGYIVETGPY
ncbi:MAG: hypothetical protein R3B09_05755 [Nannocystaceae bacterium]